MPAPTVRADFAQLTQIAGRFARMADDTARSNQDITQRLERLRAGDWYGDSATRFFGEMDSAILPAMTKLQQALVEAAQVTRRIRDAMQQAERDVAAIMRDQTVEAPPPRVYVVNGINNDGSGFPEMRAYLVNNGYPAGEVRTTPAVYDTRSTFFSNLAGRLGFESGGTVMTTAQNMDGLTNTVSGIGQVAAEYVTGGASQTNRVQDFITRDLQNNPLLPGQSVVFVGHSGGGAIVTNLAPRLESVLIPRADGTTSALNVESVVTLGSPVANYDNASQVARVVQIRHEHDYVGLPLLRSNEMRAILPGTLAQAGTGRPVTALVNGALLESWFSNPGARSTITINAPAGSVLEAHSSYYQKSNRQVWDILLQQNVLPAP
jgi:WXG100 family type VII secretion target